MLYSSVVPPEDYLSWDNRWTLGQSRYWAEFYRGWTHVRPDTRVIDVLGKVRDRDVALDSTLLVNQRIVDWATSRDLLLYLESAIDPAVRPAAGSSCRLVRGTVVRAGPGDRQGRTRRRGSCGRRVRSCRRHRVGGDGCAFLAPRSGASLHEEMDLLVRAGLSAGQVLCAGDPLKSITDTTRIAAVCKDGEPVYAADSALLGTAREGSPP